MSATRARINASGLQVDPELYDFVSTQVLPGLNLSTEAVWSGMAELVAQAAPRIAQALETRATLQAQIDGWHREHTGQPHDPAAYREFLESIGYLVPVGEDFSIETDRVDHEISQIAGPQLVVPVSNARYSLNAANARWGSLYDAVYGTDVLGTHPPAGPYDAARGEQVVDWVREFLDDIFPLREGSHRNARTYRIAADGSLEVVELGSVSTRTLANPESLAGYTGDPASPSSVLFTNHGLGVILEIDREHPIGQTDGAGIKDVVLESAITTIVDFEDSVAAVDASDKVAAYRNWLGLMRGDLTTWVTKGQDGFERKLEPNRSFATPGGGELEKRGRALLLVRNVGHLMTTDAVLDKHGAEIPRRCWTRC